MLFPPPATDRRATPPLPVGDLIDAGLSRPGRYLGLERGVEPRSWDRASVRWVLAYPELYEIGASNTGHIILYSILNAQPRQLCDRAYLPAPDLASRLRQRQRHMAARPAGHERQAGAEAQAQEERGRRREQAQAGGGARGAHSADGQPRRLVRGVR